MVSNNRLDIKTIEWKKSINRLIHLLMDNVIDGKSSREFKTNISTPTI